MRTFMVILAGCFIVSGCSKPPTASDVCSKLVAAGVGSNCKPSSPTGLGAAAKEKVDFDLAAPAGKGGGVYAFADDASYTSTVEAFQKAAMLAGPHRYGNPKARIFVQMNDGASPELGSKAKAVVEGL